MVYTVSDYVLHVEPFPGPADVLYLTSYPLLAGALLVLIRSRTGGRDRSGLIDALIITTGLGLLSWTFLMQPIASDTSLTLASRLISIAYPLADVLLLAVLARLFTSPGARSASYRLLGAALLLQLGADIVFAGLTAVGTYSGGLLDLGWMVSYLCWGAAALHPSVRSLSEVAPARGVRVNRRRLLVLAPAALLAPALLLYQGIRGLPIGWVPIGVGSVVLFLLVVARMAELVAQVQDQATQLDALAHNDALTGIPNRRAWDLDLVREMARARRGGVSLQVALLDVDHFKRFNDSQRPPGRRPAAQERRGRLEGAAAGRRHARPLRRGGVRGPAARLLARRRDRHPRPGAPGHAAGRDGLHRRRPLGRPAVPRAAHPGRRRRPLPGQARGPGPGRGPASAAIGRRPGGGDHGPRLVRPGRGGWPPGGGGRGWPRSSGPPGPTARPRGPG